MSKMDILNSYLTERLACAVREILEAVEATVTEYRQESAQTRLENQELREQLKDALSRAETAGREINQKASATVSEDIPACGPKKWSSSLEQSEVQKHQKQDPKWSEGSVNEDKPHTLVPSCKKESYSLTEGTQGPNFQQDLEVSLPVIRLQRVKIEPEETEIPVSLPNTDASSSYSPITAQRTLSPSRSCHRDPLSDTHVTGEEVHSMTRPKPSTFSEKATNEVNGAAEYKCSHCRKTFRELKKLQTHQQAHERAFGCNWCGKGFYQSADLRRHLRTHTGERPYRCTWCSKSFSQRSNLRRHMRIHTGERPYQCNLCTQSFSDGHTLKKHQRKHYEERYCCSLCDQSFTVARSLQLHLLKQHLIEQRQ